MQLVPGPLGVVVVGPVGCPEVGPTGDDDVEDPWKGGIGVEPPYAGTEPVPDREWPPLYGVALPLAGADV